MIVDKDKLIDDFMDYEYGGRAYYDDWNKLMDVFEKIEHTRDPVSNQFMKWRIQRNWVEIFVSTGSEDDYRISVNGDTTKEAAFKAVTRFISYYNTQNEIDLLPCPFCGSGAMIIEIDDGTFSAMCEYGHCPAQPDIEGNSKEEVAKAWNIREGSDNANGQSLKKL